MSMQQLINILAIIGAGTMLCLAIEICVIVGSWIVLFHWRRRDEKATGK